MALLFELIIAFVKTMREDRSIMLNNLFEWNTKNDCITGKEEWRQQKKIELRLRVSGDGNRNCQRQQEKMVTRKNIGEYRLTVCITQWIAIARIYR